MFVLLSHHMTKHQQNDAQNIFGVNKFDMIPLEIWSQIPSESENIDICLVECKAYLSKYAKKGDYLFVQGDYGATYNMVQYAKKTRLVPVYATSVRKSHEVVNGEHVTTVKEFRHVRFRTY